MRYPAVLALLGSFAASEAFGADTQISMSGQGYAPAQVEILVGDTLVFFNDDDTSHEVLIPTVGFATDLGRQDPLAETRLTVGRAGVFDVRCVFHEHMHARVVVTP